MHNHIPPPPPSVSEDSAPRDSRGKGMKSSPWYIQMLDGKPQSQGSGSCNTTHQALTWEGNETIPALVRQLQVCGAEGQKSSEHWPLGSSGLRLPSQPILKSTELSLGRAHTAPPGPALRKGEEQQLHSSSQLPCNQHNPRPCCRMCPQPYRCTRTPAQTSHSHQPAGFWD